jgi:hypothetical protein
MIMIEKNFSEEIRRNEVKDFSFIKDKFNIIYKLQEREEIEVNSSDFEPGPDGEQVNVIELIEVEDFNEFYKDSLIVA